MCAGKLREIFAALFAMAAAASPAPASPPDPAALRVQVAPGANPWTHLDLQNRPENFSFAIVSDLTGGYRPGIFPWAVARLNLLRPEFVLSVGDLIEGYTEDRAQVVGEWETFDGMLAPLVAPFFYVPGNHDYSNPMMAAVWEERLGRDYYHFVYRDVLFLMLNSEEAFTTLPPEAAARIAEYMALRETDMEAARKAGAALMSGIDWEGTMEGELSEEQIRYFERVIAENPDVRWALLFLHKPLWQGDGNAGLARIEAALGERPFTVFAGHVHTYKRFEVGGRVHIRLGTTGGDWTVPIPEAPFYDHVVWVTMTPEGPSIANLLLEGILDEYGRASP